MNEDSTEVVDTSANTPSEAEDAVESMSSEAFLGGIDAAKESVESNEEATADKPKDESTDQAEEVDQTTEKVNDSSIASDEGMSESERNAYFAQRRIAAKQQNDNFIESLKTETREYVDEVDETKFEDMDPEQAEILKNAQKMTREMEVEKAIREVERSRETTAHSILEAESKLPAFNPNHKDYIGEELHNEALADWTAAYCRIEKDGQGNPQIVGVREGAPSPYAYLEEKAAKYTKFSKEMQARAQTHAARNNATAEIVPVQQSGKGDSLEELEERVGNISLA